MKWKVGSTTYDISYSLPACENKTTGTTLLDGKVSITPSYIVCECDRGIGCMAVILSGHGGDVSLLQGITCVIISLPMSRCPPVLSNQSIHCMANGDFVYRVGFRWAFLVPFQFSHFKSASCDACQSN